MFLLRLIRMVLGETTQRILQSLRSLEPEAVMLGLAPEGM